MADITAAVSQLRHRMIDEMSLRNLSPATQRSYIHAVKRFSRVHGRSPDPLGLEDVRAFQVYFVSQGVSWGALNQTVCALRSFTGSRWIVQRSRSLSPMPERLGSSPIS